MNKKYLFLIYLFLILSFNCNSKELRGEGNPKIGKIVKISETRILSEYEQDNIIPKYKLYLELKDGYKILDLKLKTDYIFGQDLNLISSKIIILDSKELEILNNTKKCCLTISLKAFPLEKAIHENAEGELNEERISNIFIYLKYK